MRNHITGLIADTDLVKAMIQNLHCISYAGANDILTALTVRASDEARAGIVSPTAVRGVIAVLPPLPSVCPRDQEYKYRAPSAAIRQAWAVVDAAANEVFQAAR